MRKRRLVQRRGRGRERQQVLGQMQQVLLLWEREQQERKQRRVQQRQQVQWPHHSQARR